MTIQSEPREFLSGKLAQVDVGKIENQLRALWKQATNDADGIAGDVVRAVSFTLIMFSHDETTEAEIASIMDDIMAYHPCRAILTYFRPEKKHALDAYVSARCHLTGDKRHVCSEQITVYADGARPEELASVVKPLLLSDLPVVLWWRSRNLGDPVLDTLGPCSRKLIFDSGYQPFELDVLQKAAELLINRAECIWLADLNWRRLNGWRRSLAEAFDGFPMPAEYLKKISKVRIHVRGDGKSGSRSAQAALLTGWLASRLNWQDKQIRNVEYAVSDENNAAAKGAIDRIDIEFQDGRHLNVQLERHNDSFLIVANEKVTGSTESTRVDQHFAEGVLIGQELEMMSRDRIFEQSLLRAAEITRILK
jgi:glucose-6-phosphate dehydrogenase assembly protein OpcA